MNFLQHFDHRLVRAAVQRPPQRAHARGATGEQVRLARRHHAHGGGGAILLVVRVQQENQIQRLDHLRLQFKILVRRREQHVQEVRRVFVGLLRINQRQPARLAIGIRRNRPHLRNQPGHIQVKIPGLAPFPVHQALVEAARRVDHRRKNRHRMRARRKTLEMKLHVLVQKLVVREQIRKTLATARGSAGRRK